LSRVKMLLKRLVMLQAVIHEHVVCPFCWLYCPCLLSSVFDVS